MRNAKKFILQTIFVLACCVPFLQSNAQTTTVDGSAKPSAPQMKPAELKKQLETRFMNANKKIPGMVTTASGLQYKVLTEGTGPKPNSSDTVEVDYEGKLLNGKIFDSSYQRGEPISFPVSGVIPGWQEALQLMPEGSTWMLYIPSELAYGSEGAGGVIGPNETLVFKVHLIKIK